MSAGITLFYWLGRCDSPQEEMYNHGRWNERKNRHICLRTFSLRAVMDDRPGVECVFVFCRGAKWPGMGANRKRACPQTNEQHYSNAVFVVSAVCCGLNTAVTDYVWCSVSVCPSRTGEIRCLVLDLTVLLQVSWSMIHLLKSNT